MKDGNINLKVLNDHLVIKVKVTGDTNEATAQHKIREFNPTDFENDIRLVKPLTKKRFLPKRKTGGFI